MDIGASTLESFTEMKRRTEMSGDRHKAARATTRVMTREFGQGIGTSEYMII